MLFYLLSIYEKFMDALLNIKPGLVIWSLINFSIFLFILIKFGAKPIITALKNRENKINDAIASAEEANKKAEALLAQSQEKFDAAQNEVASIISKGREYAEDQIKKALDEAERVKNQKIEEATREIARSKETAIRELRAEVANLVVSATEKIIEDKLDKEKDYKLIESFIEKLPKN